MPTGTEIRLATSDADRQLIYAFRYTVIVEELGLDIATADHHRRLVIDPEDHEGYLFAALKGDVVVGTARVNFLREGLVQPHCCLLGLDQLPASERDVTSVSGRFLVAQRSRSTGLAIRILQMWYRFLRHNKSEQDYILVRPKIADMYIRLGYLKIGGALQHPEVGEVLPMRLHPADEQHLRSIRSAFVRCLDEQSPR
jgi:predicted GNAT family N-acyltransferase